MNERPSGGFLRRLPLLLGNACVVGLLILVISASLLRQPQADVPSSAGFVFLVTAVCLGPLGVVTMLTGWFGLIRNGHQKYSWFALATGAFSSAIGLNFGLRML